MIMSVKKIIPLLLFLSSLGVLFVYGFSKKVSTFGIEGTLVFEADNAAGTTVIYTTGTQSPLDKDIGLFVHEVVLQDGAFFRPINEYAGEDINIWIYKKGYPVFNLSRVLNPDRKNIDFGKIFIPKAFKIPTSTVSASEAPLQGYRDICLQDTPLLINPSEIKCIMNYTMREDASERCSKSNARKVYGAKFLFKVPKKYSAEQYLREMLLFFGR
jgi:hypothetical protein